MSDETNQLGLLGASGDVGNLGIEALMRGTVSAVATCSPGTRLTVFDYGRGIRDDVLSEPERQISYRRCGLYPSRRFYRQENLANVRLAGRLGGGWNPISRHIRSLAAALDLSGGDSFTDLYGQKRFDGMTGRKLLMLQHGVPLVLLPQTYGPFRDPANRALAARIVSNARIAWARDPRSMNELRDLLGEDFDPQRHKLGCDMAFQMQPTEPPRATVEAVARFRASDPSAPMAGINVSGLICSPGAEGRFDIKIDYFQVQLDLARRIAEAGGLVLLLPHVLEDASNPESDQAACARVREGLPEALRERVLVAPGPYDSSQAKWLIRDLDWFSGTRMHSTIAALSTGTPVTAVAYSLKTEPLFASFGLEDLVLDARSMESDAMLSMLLQHFEERETTRGRVATLPVRAREAVLGQTNEILEALELPAAILP